MGRAAPISPLPYIRAELNLEAVEGAQDGLGLVVSSGSDRVDGDQRALVLERRIGYEFHTSRS
jgi:hypothetical protein